ncbi:hypothetical protein SDC9_91143 [bioreactor metagenome]|uniref:Uncharacterized protein n=1 Tax=bioreactor metagenome TaxID=1076179 RepID=A0A644ZUB7_9ZZZZ
MFDRTCRCHSKTTDDQFRIGFTRADEDFNIITKLQIADLCDSIY